MQVGCNHLEAARGYGSSSYRHHIVIISSSYQVGCNHLETARGYGSSEVQFGEALETMIKAGDCARGDFILQTKVIAPMPLAL